MQRFARLCIKKITIKNYSMTDTTREVKGESLSNAFKWWTSEHINGRGGGGGKEALSYKLPNCKF